MSNTHTPGPWQCRPLQGREAIADCRVYELDSLGADVLPDEAIANARLIAAAPELLAALGGLLSIATYTDDQGPIGQGWQSDKLIAALEAAHAAITKAEGRS